MDANWGPNNIDLLTPPDVVKGLQASRQGNVINISWIQNADFDLLGYNIFANGYWIGTVDANDTSFSIGINELPFTVKGNISIAIEAFDQDGEVSVKRATVKV